MVPDLFQAFPKQTVGNADLIHLILQRLDSAQLHDLVCLVLQGSLQLFDNDSFAAILEKSLRWETIEQIFLWELAHAHEIPVDCCLSVLPRMKFTSHSDAVVTTHHAEALSNVLMMLRRESPSENLLKHLFAREIKPNDPTVATILQYWAQRYEDKMSKLINDLISAKASGNPSPNKRKRNQSVKGASSVPLDKILCHLNHLRTTCNQTKFFSLPSMQEALAHAQVNCNEVQKRRYSDLFALLEEEKDRGLAESKKPKNARSRRHKVKKKRDSSTSETSEEEDIRKPVRKRKKNIQMTSDSD